MTRIWRNTGVVLPLGDHGDRLSSGDGDAAEGEILYPRDTFFPTPDSSRVIYRVILPDQPGRVGALRSVPITGGESVTVVAQGQNY
ncbi:MAG: hypothetical protein AAF725_22985, partial [Acidobacteriota bacterium]